MLQNLLTSSFSFKWAKKKEKKKKKGNFCSRLERAVQDRPLRTLCEQLAD